MCFAGELAVGNWGYVVPFSYSFLDGSCSTVCIGRTAATELRFCRKHVGNAFLLSLSTPCAHRREDSLESWVKLFQFWWFCQLLQCLERNPESCLGLRFSKLGGDTCRCLETGSEILNRVVREMIKSSRGVLNHILNISFKSRWPCPCFLRELCTRYHSCKMLPLFWL